MTLTACATSSNYGSPGTGRTLPAPTAAMNPVPMPTVAPGLDARVAAAQARAGLSKANKRLRDSREWYESVRKGFSP